LYVNSLNDKLNPICHLLPLLGAHPILHVSRIRVNLVQALLLQYMDEVGEETMKQEKEKNGKRKEPPQ
jgi:hypothetical protein